MHSARVPDPAKLQAPLVATRAGAGDAIYDPFAGSGTTLIAAEKTGRSSFGIEISPAYVDLTVARWEKFTGKKAELR